MKPPYIVYLLERDSKKDSPAKERDSGSPLYYT